MSNSVDFLGSRNLIKLISLVCVIHFLIRPLSCPEMNRMKSCLKNSEDWSLQFSFLLELIGLIYLLIHIRNQQNNKNRERTRNSHFERGVNPFTDNVHFQYYEHLSYPKKEGGGEWGTQKTHKYLQSITTYLWLYLSTKFQVLESSQKVLSSVLFLNHYLDQDTYHGSCSNSHQK